MNTLKDVEKLVQTLFAKEFKLTRGGTIYRLSANRLGIMFQWSHAKRQFGSANYHRRTLKLSKSLCEINLDQLDGRIKDCILHELAHIFTDHIYGYLKEHHGYQWRSICLEVGGDGRRCYDASKVERPKSKYTLVCPKCSTESPMFRKPSRDRSCGPCGTGSYNNDLKLTVIKNY